MSRSSWVWGWVAVVCGALAGCGGGSTSERCRIDGDCEDGRLCVDGACLTAEESCVDEDGDGYGDGPRCVGVDCDDSDPQTHEGAAELCGDGVDNDCDGAVDDGFGALGTSCTAGLGVCQTSGVQACAEDGRTMVCDARPPEPGAERCNELDDDCDGLVDESDGTLDCSCVEGESRSCWTGAPETRSTGICRDGMQTCLPTGAWGACEGATEPATEECNGSDMDCNGLIDDVDQDGDSYFRCPGVSDRDCDDDPSAGRNVFPGNLEECNGVDDNCNGLVDEEVLTVYYLDIDGDGYGGGAANVRACVKPEGYAETSGDCNDSNPSIHPGATEICNEADDDCNGLEDDGLPQLSIYPDNDGDGFAPPGVTAREKCDVPLGFAAEQDVESDGTPDWDCDDSRATVNPGAVARCDALDNDCDGVVDRWCADRCPGSWPFNLPSSGGVTLAVNDMDEDGASEIAAGSSSSGFLLSNQADVLWRVDGSVNVLRRPGIFADVDRLGRTGRRTREWIAGPRPAGGNVLTVVRLTPTGAEVIPTAATYGVYDAGTYAAADLDGDDRAEIVTMDWDGSVRVSGYDRDSESITELAYMASPDDRPIYTNGFGLGDVTGDGLPEILFGTGHSRASAVSRWAGRLWAFEYTPTSSTSGTLTDACPGCYDTAIEGLYSASVQEILLHDTDGDGVDELWAQVYYYETAVEGDPNTAAGQRLWRFDPATGAALAAPQPAPLRLSYDADGDGVPESHSPYEWTHDVDGDGDLDVLGSDGGLPYLRRRDAGSFDDMPTAIAAPGGLRFMGDLDSDDRLDVLISDGDSGRLHCVRFGPGTYNPWTSYGPPLRANWDTRSGQLDQGEPNDDAAVAHYQGNDRFFRGFVSSDSDADWIRHASHCSRATIQAPPSVDLRVRTYLDQNGDGTLELLRDEVIGAGTRARRTCRDDPSIADPQGNDLWIEIVGEGGSSATEPYFIEFRDSF